jgi:hypothetical protein
MVIEVTAADIDSIEEADLVAVAVGARASELGAAERAAADADAVSGRVPLPPGTACGHRARA